MQLLYQRYSGLLNLVFFVLKQKTAYEMRISDWSSDVCSSDLAARGFAAPVPRGATADRRRQATLFRRSRVRGEVRQGVERLNRLKHKVFRPCLMNDLRNLPIDS